MRRTVSLAILVVVAVLAPAQVVSEAEKKEGFRPLFDGKTFEGWKTTDQILKGWKIDNGLLMLNGGGGHLFTKDEFVDFVVRFEWRPHYEGYSVPA